MPAWSRSLVLSLALASAVFGLASSANAQTKLKWAHVYEVSEPYHAQALWAAEEIKKRTNGRYEIGVFPASQLGNENQINEGLGLGTVDMIYTGTSFAGSIHKPLAISGAPFMLRDFNHWKAYRDSKLFRDIAKGYEDKTKHKIVALDLLRRAHGHRKQGNQKARRHEGHETARAAGAALLDVGKIRRRQRHADRLRGSLSGLAAGHRGRAGEPVADHHGQEVLRSAVAHHADRPHRRVAAHHRRQPCLGKLSDDDKKVFEEVLAQAAAKASEEIRTSEQKIADQLRSLGKTVVVVDREAFRKAAIPLHNDASAGAGWSQAEYDALQALK